jgi:Flp pilus assembly protein TadG
METFNSDPKPGRIVLPLVLIGMIATTYTFVNRVSTNNELDITTPVEVEEEVVEETTDETTTTTTTTTLPDNYVAYLEEITAEKIQATELGKKVLEANQNWDDKSVTYQEAKVDFRDFIDDAEQFVITVTEPGPPNEFAFLVASHEELKTLVNLIYEDTIELLAGLESSDTGEQRAAALDAFNRDLDIFINKIEEIVAAATSS